MDDAFEQQIAEGNSADDQAPSSISDLIRDFNENQGLDPKKDTPPPVQDIPDPAAKPADAPDPKTPDPAKPDLKTPSSTTIPPKDPEWANRNGDKPKPAGDAAASTEKTDDPAQKPGDVDPAVGQQTYSRLSELTSGTIKSENDFLGLIDRYNELATQAEEGFKPKFKNDAHRHAFELLAAASEGQELDVARRTLHTLSLDTSKLKGKDLLFEGFLLDPENSDLTREQAWELFDEDFEKKYSGASEDKLLARELQKKERQAKELIEKTQGDFKTASSKASEEPQVDPKVMASVKRAVDEFGGLTMGFSDDAAENEMLSIAADDPEELERLNRYVLNPQEYWKDLIQDHTTEQGFDYPGFVRTMYEHSNLQKIKRLVYDHGFETGKLSVLNKDRNSTTKSEKVKDTARVPAGGKKEAANFYEAFDNALNGR
jgi:hypothetical protein